MLQGRALAVAGVALLLVLVGAVVLVQVLDDDGDDNDVAASPPAAPADDALNGNGDGNGDGAPGDLPDLDDLDPQEPSIPPEVQTFLETHSLAGSVLHYTLEQEAAEAEELADDSYAIGDFWIEIGEDEVPSRLVVRFFDRDGEMLEALYSDGEEEVVALFEETRRGTELEQGCVNRGPASPQLFFQTLPFVVEAAVLEMEGFEGAPESIEGAGPSTEVDDRVGEPDRTLSLPPWADANQYEQEDEAQRIVVVVDPETQILMGQALMGPTEDGEQAQFRQAMGDIHVHDNGANEPFDFQDALDLCEELES